MNRPDPAHKETDRLIAKMEKEISAAYAQANYEVTEKLSDYLSRFARKDTQWRQWVKTGKRTEEEYQKWLYGQIMMGKRWSDLRDSLANDYVNTHAIAEAIVNGYTADVYAINHNYATYQIEHDAMINTSYTLYSKETVERLWRENPVLYKAPGREIQRLIREGELKRWNSQQIQSVMIQGILQGESIPNLAKRLKKVTGGEHNAAIRNARTMMTGVQNAGRMDAIARANAMGIPTQKTWMATFDRRTRHWHRELDGVTLPEKEPFKNAVGKIMYPGDPTAAGANIYNCRCTLLTTIKGHEIDLTKNRGVYYDKEVGNMTYDQWKAEKKSKSLPITHQEDVSKAIRGMYIAQYWRGK